MIYQGLRVVPAAGQGAALAAAVGPYLKLVEKHGGKPVGAWNVTVGQGWGDYTYLNSFADMGAYGKFNDALRNDPEWQDLMTNLAPQIAAVNISLLQPLPESGLQ